MHCTKVKTFYKIVCNLVSEQAMETQTAVVGLGEDNSNTQMTPVVIFNCHICNKQFEKKLTYQRHLRTHSEHNPTMVRLCSDFTLHLQLFF